MPSASSICKDMSIKQFINPGEFAAAEIPSVQHLLADAGAKLDHAHGCDITGCPVFQAEDGRFYTGRVEFVVSEVNPAYLVDILADGDHCECQNCGHINTREELGEIADYGERVEEGEEEPDGECSECRCLSHEITKDRALEIANPRAPQTRQVA